MKNIRFEEDYELIKTNPNVLFEEYYEKLQYISNGVAYRRNFNQDDLFQQCYIYFIELCERYDPYYNYGFIPFKNYLFSNMFQKLKAYVQRSYGKAKRIQNDFDNVVINLSSTPQDTFNPTVDYFDELEFNYEFYKVLSEFSDVFQAVIIYTLQGLKQWEIGEILGISQSRVSSIIRSIRNPSEVDNKNNRAAKELKKFVESLGD